MYSLKDYGSMIADRVRMDAYAYALKQAVEPDSVVLDIGAGPGIMALLACKFGARRVYAVDTNESLALAHELAEANGFGDKIEFFHDLSQNITLPEPANVIVSDLRGALPLYGNHLPAIIDARERHLAPDGVLIPQQDTVWVALVEAPYIYRDLTKPWVLPYGLSMQSLESISLNSMGIDYTGEIRDRNLLTEPIHWANLDYTTIESPDAMAAIESSVKRDGVAHGWLVWFDAELFDDIGITNGPAADKMAKVYGRAFFPLLEQVNVAGGDIVKLYIKAELDNDEYVWGWHTAIHSYFQSDEPKALFEQSTAIADEIYNSSLVEHVGDTAPRLPGLDCYILERMDGRTPLRDIARQTLIQFPHRFQGEADAFLYIVGMASRHDL